MDFDEVWQDDEEAPSEMPGFDEDDKDDVRQYRTLTSLLGINTLCFLLMFLGYFAHLA